jgi:hypothetical protein
MSFKQRVGHVPSAKFNPTALTATWTSPAAGGASSSVTYHKEQN